MSRYHLPLHKLNRTSQWVASKSQDRRWIPQECKKLSPFSPLGRRRGQPAMLHHKTTVVFLPVSAIRFGQRVLATTEAQEVRVGLQSVDTRDVSAALNLCPYFLSACFVVGRSSWALYYCRRLAPGIWMSIWWGRDLSENVCFLFKKFYLPLHVCSLKDQLRHNCCVRFLITWEAFSEQLCPARWPSETVPKEAFWKPFNIDVMSSGHSLPHPATKRKWMWVDCNNPWLRYMGCHPHGQDRQRWAKYQHGNDLVLSDI